MRNSLKTRVQLIQFIGDIFYLVWHSVSLSLSLKKKKRYSFFFLDLNEKEPRLESLGKPVWLDKEIKINKRTNKGSLYLLIKATLSFF